MYAQEHVLTLDLAFRLREGQTLTAVLEHLKQQDFARLAGSMTARNTSDTASTHMIIQSCKDLLVQLHKSQYSLYITGIDKHPAALHLVKQNILFFDGKIIRPQYRAVEHAIKEYLHLNKLIGE